MKQVFQDMIAEWRASLPEIHAGADPFRDDEPHTTEMVSRNREIVTAYEMGLTLTDVAQIFGIARSSIPRIIRRRAPKTQ